MPPRARRSGRRSLSILNARALSWSSVALDIRNGQSIADGIEFACNSRKPKKADLNDSTAPSGCIAWSQQVGLGGIDHPEPRIVTSPICSFCRLSLTAERKREHVEQAHFNVETTPEVWASVFLCGMLHRPDSPVPPSAHPAVSRRGARKFGSGRLACEGK